MTWMNENLHRIFFPPPFFCTLSIYTVLHSSCGMRRNVGLQTVTLCASVFAHETVHSVPISLRHQIVQQRVDGSTEVEEHRGHQVEILRQVVQEILRVGVCAIEGCVVFCDVQVDRRHSLIGPFIRIRICLKSKGGEARVSTSACADLVLCDYVTGGFATLPKGADPRIS